MVKIKKKKKKSMTVEVLKSVLTQFTDNQNHHQKIFIQFFLGIIIVVVGFGVVLLNVPQNTEFWSVPDSCRTNPNAYYYSTVHLIVTYIITQFVLIIINSFSLSNAYSFRRDQKVVENIRKITLGKELYFEIFGDKAYSARNKRMWRRNVFMPTFYLFFWQFVWTLQLTTSAALITILYFFLLNPFMSHALEGWISVIFLVLMFLGVSWFWRYHYYIKYLKKVDEIDCTEKNRFIRLLAKID